MTWRYGVMKHPDGTFAVHEIYLNKKGSPDAWTEDPIDLAGFEDVAALKDAILTMMNDVEIYPALDYPGEKMTHKNNARILASHVPSNMTPAAWNDALMRAISAGDSWFVFLCKDVGEKAIGEAVESMAKAMAEKDELIVALALQLDAEEE